MDDVITRLGAEVLVCDGAMGTMLHAAGNSLDRPLPELNISHPQVVRAIHERYLARGAQIIQTNTFSATEPKLRSHGIEGRTAELNLAGVRIAREAIEARGEPVLLAGAVGPVATGTLRNSLSARDRRASLEQQLTALLEGGVDLIVFETFSDLDELCEAVRIARRARSDVPIVAQMTFVEDGRTLAGQEPAQIAPALERLGVDVVGVNCSLGPQGVLQVLRQFSRFTSLPLAAQPNAGLAKLGEFGRFTYRVEVEYFARQLTRCVEVGARIVGGCCGTTPDHIAAVVKALSASGPRPVLPRARATGGAVSAPPVAGPPAAPLNLAERLGRGEFVVAAEITPAGDEAEGVVVQAEALQRRGVNAVAVTAGRTSRAQMSTVSTAMLLRQRAGVDPVVSITTWDRTIMALQADLLGAHSCGIRNVICETGMPPPQGDYPNVDGVWDVDSIGLMQLLHGLNEGRDHNGIEMRVKTRFAILGRINPGAQDARHELRRARLKIAAGAAVLITEPVYELDRLRWMLEGLAREPPVPILLGLRPLVDFSEADYLRHEVPDVLLPSAVAERMLQAGDLGRETGLEICRELVREARPLVRGVMVSVTDRDADPGVLLDEIVAQSHATA